MTAPLVSILIPAFNAERWIEETLQSALAQTWPRKEVLVVDDGSTDGTVEIVRRYESRALRLIRQPRTGPSAAQNEAYRQAQGDFIQRLDADDLISPDRIRQQLQRIADEPTSIACGPWARFHVRVSDAVPAPSRVSCDLDPVERLLRECEGGLPMLQPGQWLAPRAIVDAAGPWDERLTLNNDFEYIVRLLLAARQVRWVRDEYLYYRSGNPWSLGSTRSSAGWRSALLSFELGTGHLLARNAEPRARRACADVFQTLAFDAFLEDGGVSGRAAARAADLGGSDVRMGGGLLFRALERTMGWRFAKRCKVAAYRAGYGFIASTKARARDLARPSAA